MPTSSTNFGLSKPLVNDATDQDLWGGYLNTDLDSIDSLLLKCLNFTVSVKTTTITVAIPTAGTTTTGSAKTLFLCNATGGAFSANLPAAATATNMEIAFKKTDSSANAITIDPNASETIDGATTYALSAQYDWVVLVCDGTSWHIVSRIPPAATIPVIHHQEFTASDNFTAPAATVASTVFKFILTGAGGGGSGGVFGGSGGGAGATAIYYASGLTALSTYAIVIGAAGTAGAGAGGNGGDSTLVIGATTVTAGGGIGATSVNGGPGAAGGTATNGNVNIRGGGGASGTNSSQVDTGGNGGASYWGGGAEGSNSHAGYAATCYGAGGSGGSGSPVTNGGAGCIGYATVEWVL